jgi:dipeptidyl aminopeptidase/acylaminoacyl peptidase
VIKNFHERFGMADIQIAPYGTWKSSIGADLVANSPHGWIGQLWVEGDQLYVLRNYPDQGGRGVVARMDASGNIEDITPHPYYARTRVYEYGGACYAVHEGVVYFSNVPDNRLYRHVPGQNPEPITAAGTVRYADFVVDSNRRRVICIREDHRPDGEPLHTIAAVDLDGQGQDFGQVLFDRTDFVAFPALSPDGNKLAWIGWNHPNMPFYSSSLWVADVLPDGSLANVQEIVSEQEESMTDPRWSPDGILYFCTDRNNWWNLYRWQDGRVEHVANIDAELGNPFWNIGLRMYRFLTPTRVVAAHNRLGTWGLILIDTQTGQYEPLPTPFTFIARIELIGEMLYLVAASPTLPRTLASVDLRTGAVRMIDHSVKYDVPDNCISVGKQIEYPTERGLHAYGFYHAPKNPDYRAPDGELPPLIVEVHGGPTGSTKNALDMSVQYYTSRGFAVLAVNYGGSAGYGREYRNRLRGQWGVVDVEDAVNGAKYLISQGLADPARTMIRGGSAGGFTTFAALAFTDAFKAGSSLFGISDVEVFHKETHKYESRYCETLVGPYPERRDLYFERSAMSKVDQIHVPMIIFQGSEDKIVPRNQSIFVRDALLKRKVPVYYVEFEGEGHGFRRYESVVKVLESELAFWGMVFGFQPADTLSPLDVAGL